MVHMLGQKVTDNEFTQFEIEILKSLSNGQSLKSILETNSHLPQERILKEIELKEGLIARNQGTLVLSKKGKAFIESWK